MTVVSSMGEGKLEEKEDEKEDDTGERKELEDTEKEKEDEEEEEVGGAGSCLRLSASIGLVHLLLYSKNLGEVMTLSMEGENCPCHCQMVDGFRIA